MLSSVSGGLLNNAERSKFPNQLVVLYFMMPSVTIWKIITNLKYLVIIKTHHLLIDLSVSHETNQKLGKLVEVSFLLYNYGLLLHVRHKPWLLMLDLGDSEEKFEGFMIHLVSTFKQLDKVSAAGGFNSEKVKKKDMAAERSWRMVVDVLFTGGWVSQQGACVSRWCPGCVRW